MIKNKVGFLGIFLALALIVSYVETLIPFHFAIPGIKLGLTNIVVLMVLYYVGVKEAFVLSIARVLLAGFMFGNLFSIIYSLGGGILSLFVMFLGKKTNKFSVLGVSVLGGVTHNIGQLLIAILVVENINLVYYIPVLMISGVVTGFVIGMVSEEILIRLKNT